MDKENRVHGIDFCTGTTNWTKQLSRTQTSQTRITTTARLILVALVYQKDSTTIMILDAKTGATVHTETYRGETGKPLKRPSPIQEIKRIGQVSIISAV